MSTDQSTTLLFRLADILNENPVSVEIIPGDEGQWNTDGCSQEYLDPSSTFPFFVMEGNVGVPQKVLHKLYIQAAALFKSSRRAMSQTGAVDAITASHLKALSSVILLANSAHNTALNMRKHLVQRECLSPQQELDFVASLLRGSRDFVKQSIIWDHRRWLLRYLHGVLPMSPSTREHGPPVNKRTGHSDASAFPNMPPYVIQKEFAIVSQACEKYPRNYHAWTYWQFCMDTLYFSLQSPAKTNDKDYRDYVAVLTSEFSSLRRWVELHVSDHSAMHHLGNLARRFDTLPLKKDSLVLTNDSTSGDPPYLIDGASSAAHAMTLLASYPNHESLWMYVRATLSLVPDHTRRGMIVQLRSLPICRGRLAYRCLAWLAHQDGHLYLPDDSLGIRSIINGDPDHPKVKEILEGAM